MEDSLSEAHCHFCNVQAYFTHTCTISQEVQNHAQKVLLSSVFDETWISTYLNISRSGLLRTFEGICCQQACLQLKSVEGTLHQRVSLSIALEIVFQLFVLFSSSMPTVDTLSLNLFTVWSWSEKVETSMQLSSVHIREDLSRLVSRHPQHIAWWITMCAWPRQAWVVDYAVDVLNVFGLNSSQAGMTQITTFKWEQTNQLHIVPSQVRSTSLFHCVGFCVIPHGGVGYNFPIS